MAPPRDEDEENFSHRLLAKHQPEWTGRVVHQAHVHIRRSTVVDVSLGAIAAIQWVLSTLPSQMWAGLDRSYHFLRLGDLGKHPRRRKAIERR
jgi:hypothetical protein